MITFNAEHRSNGLTYVTVDDNGKAAGSFSLSTDDWRAQAFQIQETGEPVLSQPVDPQPE